ncbi:hypothetical protein LJK87_21415 [Paenibacillus sp. P25]|nr:hypothetical protein LJK87_21415 [Paenibacillus sp. P25]
MKRILRKWSAGLSGEQRLATREYDKGGAAKEALERINRSVYETAGAVSGITSAISGQVERMDDALHKTRATLDLANRISGDVRKVSSSVQEQTALMQELAASAEQLHSQADRLNSKAGVFHV